MHVQHTRVENAKLRFASFGMIEKSKTRENFADGRGFRGGPLPRGGPVELQANQRFLCVGGPLERLERGSKAEMIQQHAVSSIFFFLLSAYEPLKILLKNHYVIHGPENAIVRKF